MLEIIQSIPCPNINLTCFLFLYIGSAIIGSALLLTSKGRI